MNFEKEFKEIGITKDNYKELVKTFISKFIVDFESIPEYANPCAGISQEGMLMVMMTMISQQMTKSWCYKMKNQSFNKHFVKLMNKYSYAMCVKLFDNLNFSFVVDKFFQGAGYQESKESIQTFQENKAAYESAAEFFKGLCKSKVSS